MEVYESVNDNKVTKANARSEEKMTEQLPLPALTSRFEDALRYAHTLHCAQTRKGTAVPYFSHLMAVSALVIENGGSEEQAIAALLHDAAEDQGGAARLSNIKARFGDAVAQIVSDCTDACAEPKPAWRERKAKYLSTLRDKSVTSLLVSLADKVHNAEAIYMDYLELGDELWPRFSGGAVGTRWYYTELASIYQVRMPGKLTCRLSRAVSGFT